MTWTRSRDRLKPRQRIRWSGNEYEVLSVGAGGATVKRIKGENKGLILLISRRCEVERLVTV